jgi:hypothetical protein
MKGIKIDLMTMIDGDKDSIIYYIILLHDIRLLCLTVLYICHCIVLLYYMCHVQTKVSHFQVLPFTTSWKMP